jgi:hypothetical protein
MRAGTIGLRKGRHGAFLEAKAPADTRLAGSLPRLLRLRDKRRHQGVGLITSTWRPRRDGADGQDATPRNQGALRLHVFDGYLSTPAIPNPSGKHNQGQSPRPFSILLGSGDHPMGVCIRRASSNGRVKSRATKSRLKQGNH